MPPTTLWSMETESLFIECAFFQFSFGYMLQRAILNLTHISVFARRHFGLVQAVKMGALFTFVAKAKEPMSANNCSLFLV